MSTCEASTSSNPLVNRNLVDSKKFFCPFLSRGYCRQVTRCSFSHDKQNSIKIPNEYCHFYLANQCLYGQDCKFTHSEPSPLSNNNDHHLIHIFDNFFTSTSTNGQCSTELEGLDCDLCGEACLHPNDREQQRQHREECLREHEREMELSFAVQRSKDKVCGVCMDTVVEKKPLTSSRFGILEKCNHIFCLDCIRKWRCTKQFETRTIRACPECRVSSDFVIPSKYWVEDQEDKDRLIRDYKAALRSKPCKYFDEGRGECPFAGSCFYKHAYPDGRLAKMENPKPRRRNRPVSSLVSNYILWNIFTSTDGDDWTDDLMRSLFPDYDDQDEDDQDDDDSQDDDDDDDDDTSDLVFVDDGVSEDGSESEGHSRQLMSLIFHAIG